MSSKSKSNAINDFLNASGPAVKKITVTYLGKTREIDVKTLSFSEASKLNMMVLSDDGKFQKDNVAPQRASLISASLVDEHGKTIVNALDVMDWPVALVEKIEKEIRVVNGLGNEGKEAVEKNSEETTQGGSSLN